MKEVLFVEAGKHAPEVRLGEKVLPGGLVRFQVSAPSNGAVAPPGDYMLFVLDGAGVPSEARMVRLRN